MGKYTNLVRLWKVKLKLTFENTKPWTLSSSTVNTCPMEKASNLVGTSIAKHPIRQPDSNLKVIPTRKKQFCTTHGSLMHGLQSLIFRESQAAPMIKPNSQSPIDLPRNRYGKLSPWFEWSRGQVEWLRKTGRRCYPPASSSKWSICDFPDFVIVTRGFHLDLLVKFLRVFVEFPKYDLEDFREISLVVIWFCASEVLGWMRKNEKRALFCRNWKSFI